jgi:cytochrome c oxidase subunit 4
MPKSLLVFFLIGTAIFKASLVAMFFMHLKFEGRLIYLIAGFPCLMAVVYVLALFPDLVIGYWE